MTFSTPSAQPIVNQMPGQLMATSLGSRPGRLVTVAIFTFLANTTLTAGLSLLVFQVQVLDKNYRDGGWGGILPMSILGFIFLAAAVTIAATSSDRPYSPRYLRSFYGAIGGHPRGLFEKPAFMSLVVAFGTVGIALSASTGFSSLAFSAFIDGQLEIDGWSTPSLWPEIWSNILFGIAFLAVSIIVISTSNRPKLVPLGYYPQQAPYYPQQAPAIPNPMMPGYPNSPSVQPQEVNDASDVGTEQRSDASQEQSAPSENKTSEGQS